jgi:cysteine desulfurase
LGCTITYLPVDRQGVIDPDDVGRAITDATGLVSIIYGHNEVGTIEPIAEVARICRARGVPFHSDAVQAAGSVELDVGALGVDLMSLSAHKFYGPKGVGLLYVREGTALVGALTGGPQERELRAGTENVPGIIGLAKALDLACAARPAQGARLSALRDRLIGGLLSRVPDARLTGHPQRRLPNHASFVFAGLEAEAIIARLDLADIAASSGSACTSGEEEPSHVLLAMGYTPVVARGSVRFTLGRSTSHMDIDRVLGVLPGIICELRAMSPLYEPGMLDDC